MRQPVSIPTLMAHRSLRFRPKQLYMYYGEAHVQSWIDNEMSNQLSVSIL